MTAPSVRTLAHVAAGVVAVGLTLALALARLASVLHPVAPH